MKDITTREDVELLVNSFYQSVQADDVLGPIFNDIAQVDWPAHLPVMYDFWETILLGSGTFKGNPISAHIHLNRRVPLTEAHFSRWLELFTATVEEHFSGSKAEEAINRAHNIAQVMQWKIKSLS